MRILAVITAYHPDTSLLLKDMAAFRDSVDHILVWRNSPVDEKALAGEKVEFCGTCENVGIPKALNFAWRYARDNGYTHLLTMDQDSEWENFDVFLGKVFSESAPQDAIFGPAPDRERVPSGDFEPSMDVITSGMLIPVPVIDRIGGWHEDFFVDAVDIDFVRHAAFIGITSYLVGGCFLRQNFGNLQFLSLPGNRRIGILNYGPERLYEICRNNLIVIRRYDAQDLRKSFRKRFFLRRIPRILIAEDMRCKKMLAIIKGIRDARRYKDPYHA